MGYIPFFFDVTGRTCVVIGGDEAAERRVGVLLEAGAKVTVVSGLMTKGLADLVATERVRHLKRSFMAGDLKGATLAYCYAEDPVVARAASEEARALRIPINVSDQPTLCSFIAPAVVKRGALQVAISTSGSSPALAKILRRELELTFGPEYAQLLEILRAVRERLRHEPSVEQRSELARGLAQELRHALKQADYGEVDRILTRTFGLTLAELELEGVTPAGAAANPSSAGAR